MQIPRIFKTFIVSRFWIPPWFQLELNVTIQTISTSKRQHRNIKTLELDVSYVWHNVFILNIVSIKQRPSDATKLKKSLCNASPPSRDAFPLNYFMTKKVWNVLQTIFFIDARQFFSAWYVLHCIHWQFWTTFRSKVGLKLNRNL